MMIRYQVSGGQCDRPQQEHHQVAAQAQERGEELESDGDVMSYGTKLYCLT